MGKNTVRLTLVLMLVVSLVAGCAQTAAGDITIGLVTDIGGIDDKSFNQGTWEGIQKFAEDYNLGEEDVNFVQSESDADYIPNLSSFADEEMDLIVAPGFLFFDAMTEMAELYPDQKFLIIDTPVEAENVVSALFAEHEGSYLVGVAAALKAQDAGEDTVAFLGGMDFGLIQKFEAGFEAGVYAVDPNMNVLVDYSGSFVDTQIAQTLAAKMYDQGAYIIYHAAGNSGNGAIKEARDRVLNGEDVWMIGVDKDQYDEGIYEGDKSVILTSMVKRVDLAAYTVCEQVLNDEFAGGMLIFELANDGVGIPEMNPNMTDEWVSYINDMKEKVVSGEIVVPEVPMRVQ